MAIIRKKRGIPLDENFPSDTCRYVLTSEPPHLYCPELRRDDKTAYCAAHHVLLRVGAPARAYYLFLRNQKKAA